MLSQGAFLYEKVSKYLDQLLVFLGVLTLGIFVFLYGFPLSGEWATLLSYSLYGIAFTFVFQELLRLLFCRSFFSHVFSRRLEFLFILLLSLTLFAEDILFYLSPVHLDTEDLRNLAIGYLAFTQASIFFAQAIRFIRNTGIFSRRELTPSRLMVVSFLFPIVIGTLLLKLPNATVAGISWIDALFTATSAVCVTGLITVDTATAFTPLGQFIIAGLFQIGGLGIMTITMSFGFLFSSGLAVKERLLFSELLAEDRLGRVGKLLAQVTVFTFTVELIGALFLYSAMDKVSDQFDVNLFLNALFHSVSAFCNAGFSLFSHNLYEGVVGSNVSYSFIIMALIVVGGLGYPVFYNISAYLRDKYTKSRTSRTLIKSHTKMVLITTAVLLTMGAVLIFFAEGGSSFANLSVFEKMRHSLFLSTTARTAGFNISPVETLSIETCLILFFLMWVGGSPMSTAGGIKTLTVALAGLNLVATLRGAKRIFVFGKEVAQESVNKANAIVFGSVMVLGLSSILMIILEPDKNRLDLIFEVISAFGTVGLSRGVTSTLSVEGKWLIIVLMFVGRLGFLVVLNSFFKKFQPRTYQVLKEKIPIS